jgi:hypothetical protein
MSPTWRFIERPDLVTDLVGALTNAAEEWPSRVSTRAFSVQPPAPSVW